MTKPSNSNIINIIQEDNGTSTITWLDGDRIYQDNPSFDNSYYIEFDVQLLIHELYRQNKDLFNKYIEGHQKPKKK